MAIASSKRAWLLAPLLLLPALVQSAIDRHVLLDDPYITFRYARHLVEGLGPVWNAGERPVEGFTSFGWTVLSALGIALGAHPLVFAKWLGLACLVGLVVLPLTGLETLLRHRASKAALALMISVCPLLAFYGQSGMEHIAFALVVFAALLAYVGALGAGRGRALAGGLLGLSVLLRPEGLGVLGIVGLFEAWRLWRDRAPRGLWASRLSALAAPFLVIWVPFFAWRLATFGYPFPNTYYAKHTGGGLMQVLTGAWYTLGGLDLYVLAPGAFMLGAWLALRRFDRASVADERLGFLAWFLTAYLGYVTLVGGDDTSAFPSVRFFVPVIAPLYWLAVALLERVAGTPLARWGGGLALAALVLVGAHTDAVRFAAISQPDWRHPFAARPSDTAPPELATWIRAHTAKTDLVALPWAGAVAYYSDRPVLDTLGLNDLHIAHLPKRQRGIDVKMDPDYVLARRPKLIFVNVDRRVATGELSFEAGGGWKLGDRELVEALRRRKDYRLVTDAPTDVVLYERVGP